MYDLFDILHFLQSQKIVHRNLNPSNLLIYEYLDDDLNIIQ